MDQKYYTAFVLFAQDSITGKTVQLQCIHKYLGTLSMVTAKEVVEILKEYFLVARFFPLVLFRTPTEMKGKRVLLSSIDRRNFFLDLKSALDKFRTDDYAEYLPHITVETYPEIVGHFQCYALMQGDKILTYWRNPTWEKIEKRNRKRSTA